MAITDDSRVQWWSRLGSERERLVTDAALVPDGSLYAVGWSDVCDRTDEGFRGFLERIRPDKIVGWEYFFDANDERSEPQASDGRKATGGTIVACTAKKIPSGGHVGNQEANPCCISRQHPPPETELVSGPGHVIQSCPLGTQ